MTVPFPEPTDPAGSRAEVLLRYVELRWLEWGFEGRSFEHPWADEQDGRWHVGPDETLAPLLSGLRERAAATRAVVESHDLTDLGQPGDRWDGAGPPALERILLHLVQEYARHLGHLDIAAELMTARTGE